jgi:hypothetical protein
MSAIVKSSSEWEREYPAKLMVAQTEEQRQRRREYRAAVRLIASEGTVVLLLGHL